MPLCSHLSSHSTPRSEALKGCFSECTSICASERRSQRTARGWCGECQSSFAFAPAHVSAGVSSTQAPSQTLGAMSSTPSLQDWRTCCSFLRQHHHTHSAEEPSSIAAQPSAEDHQQQRATVVAVTERLLDTDPKLRFMFEKLEQVCGRFPLLAFSPGTVQGFPICLSRNMLP